jgi:integrase
MPLKLVAPRKGKSPNWSIRGTYLGVAVDKSCGTDRRSVAAGVLKRLEGQIERGEWPPREAAPGAGEPTFLSAAVAYLEDGGDPRHVPKLIKYFGPDILAKDITQEVIDEAGRKLAGNVSPSSRNKYVYTPVSAILKRAGIKTQIQRPKGHKGRVVTTSLTPDDAFAVIAEANKIDPELGLFLKFLLYTGCRLSEALNIQRRQDVRLDERRMWVAESKNDDPRELVIREDLIPELRAHVGDNLDGPLFRFRQGGHMKYLLVRAKLAALGITCPKRRPTPWKQPPNRLRWLNFHSFCHTWATWMRRYGGLDTKGLVATGRWRDERSASRYAHVVARDEWNRVDVLPGGKSVERKRDAS